MARGASANFRRSKTTRGSNVAFPHPAHLRFPAHGRNLSEQNVEELSNRENGKDGNGIPSRFSDRSTRSEQPGGGIWPRDLSVQSLRVHRHATVSLALQLLSQSLPRTVAGLDERNLPTLGCGPRRHDCLSRALVSLAQCAQTHDGSACVRCRRKS